MREGIEIKQLGDLCDIIGGGTPSKSREEYYNGDILWATVRDMNNDILSDTEVKISVLGVSNSSTNIIRQNNVVIATRVGLGKVCLLLNDTAINQDLKGIIPKNAKVSVKFLFWWFKSISDKIIESGTGATVQGVKIPFIKSLPFPFFSLKEQQQIVSILDKAFAAINQAKANVERNLQNAKELFQSQLNQIFFHSSASLEGDGWMERKLGEVCEKSTNIKWQENQGVDFEYIDLTAVSRDSLLITNTVSVNSTNAPSRAKKIIKTNDIIFATTRPTLKRVAKISNQFNNQICSTGYVVLRSREDMIESEIIFYFLQTDIFMDRMESIQRGTSYPAVTDNDVKDTILPFPISKKRQINTIEKLGKLRSQTQCLESGYQKQLDTLEELKKSILQKAFAGELTNIKE